MAMRHLRLAFWVPLALLITAFQTVPLEVCQQVIQTAMSATHDICDGLGRNEACYGNRLVEATPQPGFDAFNFDEVGDVVDITGIESLRLSAMNSDDGLWGIALMRMQANIPNRLETENVTMVVFGDVEIRNQVRAPYLTAIRPTRNTNVNVRRYPDPEAYVMTTLQANEIAIADGRTEDGRWLHVRMLETGETGWVSTRTSDVIGDMNRLRIVDTLSADFGPMQAFYLNSAENSENCQNAPENGVLIQTPEGVATVDLWINEVKIRLGSTAFIQARPDDGMVIKLVEGATQVEALGVDQVALAGTQITIAMNDQMQAVSAPSMPVAYSADSVSSISTSALDRPIEVAPPLDQNSLTQLQNTNRADRETPAPTPTNAPTFTPSPSATATLTFTPPPSPTLIPSATNSVVPPSATLTASTPRVTPSATYTLPPSATNTALPSATYAMPPSVTNTALPPPSATHTALPPSATNTPLPSATYTPLPPASPTTQTLGGGETPLPSATP
jgi:hypothetical protein